MAVYFFFFKPVFRPVWDCLACSAGIWDLMSCYLFIRLPALRNTLIQGRQKKIVQYTVLHVKKPEMSELALTVKSGLRFVPPLPFFWGVCHSFLPCWMSILNCSLCLQSDTIYNTVKPWTWTIYLSICLMLTQEGCKSDLEWLDTECACACVRMPSEWAIKDGRWGRRCWVMFRTLNDTSSGSPEL